MVRTVAAGLAALATRDPDAPALLFEGQAMSRGALFARASAIGRWLEAQDVRRGDRVAVYLDKSPDAVAALLGTWLAGAAYVPLDPTGPPPRLAAILGDSTPAALVTGSGKQRRLEAVAGEGAVLPATLVLGSREGEAALAARETGNTGVTAIEDDLACLLYTSGSTGRPKGVMITHSNIAAFGDWAAGFFGLVPGDRVAAHAPLHFDLSLFDVWTTLSCGATVCLVPQGLSFLGVDLVRFVVESGVTVWQSVPSVLKLMIRHLDEEEPALERLRLVFFAGEPFPPPALRALMSKLPHARFVNIYGSTEMNDVTFHEITSPPDDTSIPIGRACAHMNVLVVDDAGRIVSQSGSLGELCARGPTVAKGYWRAPEMTAERFVQNPAHDLYPDPVYRSGDLVEIGDDGLLRYVGRRDSQVKIRGNRVNLGEVEDALLGHPEIAEAAVVDVADGEGGRSLKAFLVTIPDCAPSPREIRRHCAARLPAYMVPDAVEIRDTLPRTSTGKIDRPSLRRLQDCASTG